MMKYFNIFQVISDIFIKGEVKCILMDDYIKFIDLNLGLGISIISQKGRRGKKFDRIYRINLSACIAQAGRQDKLNYHINQY